MRTALMKKAEVTTDNTACVWATPFDRRCLTRILDAMLSISENLGLTLPEQVEVRFVDDAAIAAANSRFTACNGPTNVLSFPGEGQMPGLVLVSTGAIRRECLLYGQHPTEYTLSLLAHGLAHLAGLEHGAAMNKICIACIAAARRMLE
jgi:probable rRNA maturation factor